MPFLAAIPLIVNAGVSVLQTAGLFGLKLGAGKSAWSESTGEQQATWVNSLISDALSKGVADKESIRQYVYKSLEAAGAFQGREVNYNDFYENNKWINTYLDNQVANFVDRKDLATAKKAKLTTYLTYGGLALMAIISIILLFKIFKK